MKNLIAFAVLFVFSPVVVLAAQAQSFVGNWDLVSGSTPEDQRTAYLNISEFNGKYTAQLMPGSSPPAGQPAPTFTIFNEMVDGNTLTFHCHVDVGNGQPLILVDYVLELSGGNIQGTVTNVPFNAQRVISATRR